MFQEGIWGFTHSLQCSLFSRHLMAIRATAALTLPWKFSHSGCCLVFSWEMSWNKSNVELVGIQFLLFCRAFCKIIIIIILLILISSRSMRLERTRKENIYFLFFVFLCHYISTWKHFCYEKCRKRSKQLRWRCNTWQHI